MTPPKFKVGDMVMYQPNSLLSFKQRPEYSGVTMTIIASPYTQDGYWRYPCDRVLKGRRATPIEPCLRLIKDGDLQLDEEKVLKARIEELKATGVIRD